MKLVVGVDEVGRGPLAGPVVTCAVLWPSGHTINTMTDSKKLSKKKRWALIPAIKKSALRISYGRAEVQEIDHLNILQATMLAMERAVFGLGEFYAAILIDGNRVPNALKGRARAVVCGDELIPAISAASVLAKVARDQEMAALAETYPGYGFERNAGYPTKNHIKAIQTLGVVPVHRKSFGPIKKILEKA